MCLSIYSQSKSSTYFHLVLMETSILIGCWCTLWFLWSHFREIARSSWLYTFLGTFGLYMVQNISHVTTSAVYCCYYYQLDEGQKNMQNQTRYGSTAGNFLILVSSAVTTYSHVPVHLRYKRFFSYLVFSLKNWLYHNTTQWHTSYHIEQHTYSAKNSFQSPPDLLNNYKLS